MKDYFLRKLEEIESRNAGVKAAEEKRLAAQREHDRVLFEKLGTQLDALARPAFEAFAQALDERKIKVLLRFEPGVPERAQELPPLAEVEIVPEGKPMPGTERRYALSYSLDGANYVMRLAIGAQQRRAILAPPRLTEARMRRDLELLLEAALAPMPSQGPAADKGLKRKS